MQERLHVALWVGLALGSLSRITVQAQSCDPGLENNWLGGQSNLWHDANNWFLGLQPGPDHHVIFDQPASTIMDILDVFPEGRKICTMTVLDEGETKLGAAETGDSDDKTRLYLYGDLKREDFGNDHVMRLGPWDGVFVGAPAASNPPGLISGDGVTLGLQWFLQGEDIPPGGPFKPAVVIVSDTIGCGQWDAELAHIVAGFKYASLEDGVFFPDPSPGALGTIDSGLCDFPAPLIISDWLLDGVTLRAKKAYNLWSWLVTQTQGQPNDFQITEYFAAPAAGGGNFTTTFSGKKHSRFLVGFTGDPENPQAEEGLRILNQLVIQGPPDDLMTENFNEELLKGPRAIAEKLRVEPGARLILSDGVDFHASNWWDDTGSLHIGTRFPAEVLFLGNSSLRYGPRLGTDQLGCDDFQCVSGDPDCVPCQPITLFDVQDQYDNPRTPALRFEDQSYIATANPIPSSGVTNQEMELRLRTHLNVESVVTQPPAIGWYTAEVDLVVEPPGNLTMACGGEGAGCPAELEAFSADSCNVWFTDVHEPRSLKAWRNFHAKERNLVPAYVKLVDRHDNDRPIPGDPCPPGEAMYVRDNVTVDVADNGPVDLTHHRIYYGGVLSVDGPQGFTGGSPVAMIKTEWGDFNGDCMIDSMDASFFPQVPPGGSIPAPLPFFDYDGDGDVDGVEVALLQGRMNQSVTCDQGPDPWSCLPLCPQQGSCGDAGLYLKVQGLPDWLPIALKVKGISSDVACVGTPPNPKYVNANGRLGATPVFRTASQWGVVWIGGPEFVPDATYDVQVHYGAAGLSASRSFRTSRFGDTDGNCIVDNDDILQVLEAFSTCYDPRVLDCSFYPNDVAQITGGRSHIIDVDDIIGVLTAFEGPSYGCNIPIGPCGNLGCSDGMSPGAGSNGPSGPDGCEGTLELTASEEEIRRGDTVAVEVYLESSSAIRGYQVTLRVSGGSAGTLTLVDLTIDGVRSDFLFHGESFVTAVDETGGRAASALYEGGVAAGSPKNLAVFTFQATQDAAGEFAIDVEAAGTLLRDVDLTDCPWELVASVPVTIKGY